MAQSVTAPQRMMYGFKGANSQRVSGKGLIFLMGNSIGRKNEILILFLWMGAGLLSWWMSKYVLSYFLSLLFIEQLRTINAVTQSLLVKNMANMIFVHSGDFILCFLFSIPLSYFTDFTKYRISMFIFGAIAISLYLQVVSLITQMQIYSELPSWAMTSYLQGFISLLLIVPILSLLGCKIGCFLSTKAGCRR